MQNKILPNIPLKTYRFIFSFKPPVKLPKFPGSAWRGAFGNALKKTVCVVRNTQCKECLLKSSCAYSYIFETPPPENTQKMRKYEAAPHPFVIQLTEQDPATPDQYLLDMLLFGRVEHYFPYIIYALERAGELGIGGHLQKFHLQSIFDQTPDGKPVCVYAAGKLTAPQIACMPPIPEMPAHIRIHLLTPMRIKRAGKNVSNNDFSFDAFFNTLLRRISLISYLHTNTPLDIDFKALADRARQIEFQDKQLSWFDWTRYSSRQQTEMNMGGVVGTLRLDCHGLEDFWPYLWLGQWTHVGKGTSMGLGEYRIEMTSLSDQMSL